MLTLLITGCGKSKNGNTSIVTPLPSEVTPSSSAMSPEESPPSETSSIDIPIPDAPPEASLPPPYPLKDIPLEELGEDYTAEAAVLDGCVVYSFSIPSSGQGIGIGNETTVREFVAKAKQGENVHTRLAFFISGLHQARDGRVYDAAYEDDSYIMTWYEDGSFEQIALTFFDEKLVLQDPLYHRYSSDLEAAVNAGCVIKDRVSNTIHNRDIFDNFVSKCVAGESASIYFGTYRSYIDPNTGITYPEKFTLNLSRFDFDGEAYTVSSYKDSYINEKFEMAEVSEGEALLYKERYQHFVISEVPSPGEQYSEVPDTRAYLFLHDDAYSYTDIFASVALAKTIPHYEILVEDME